MKLWILRPRTDVGKRKDPWDPWKGKTFGFVIRADSEKDARKMATANGGDEVELISNGHPDAWLDSNLSSCAELTAEGEEEVILEDEHSG